MSDGAAHIATLEQRVAWLEQRVHTLGTAAASAAGTGITSQSFFKRAFSVWGHWLVAHMIIATVVGILFACIGALFGAAMMAALGEALSSFTDSMNTAAPVQSLFLGLF